MPNYCTNYVTITHKDSNVIDRLVRGFNNGSLFGEFIPMPRKIAKSGDWNRWAIDSWGTKWDVGNNGFNTLNRVRPTTIRFVFDTAWSPPIAVFDHWVDIGCQVRARFSEPSAELKGIYKNKLIFDKSDPSAKPEHSLYYRAGCKWLFENAMKSSSPSQPPSS